MSPLVLDKGVSIIHLVYPEHIAILFVFILYLEWGMVWHGDLVNYIYICALVVLSQTHCLCTLFRLIYKDTVISEASEFIWISSKFTNFSMKCSLSMLSNRGVHCSWWWALFSLNSALTVFIPEHSAQRSQKSGKRSHCQATLFHRCLFYRTFTFSFVVSITPLRIHGRFDNWMTR